MWTGRPVSGGDISETAHSGHPSGDPPEAPHQLFEKAQNLIHFQGHGRMVLVQHSYPMFFYFRYVFLTLKWEIFHRFRGVLLISGHPSGDPPEAPHQLFEKAQNLIHFQGHGRMVLVQHSYPMFFYFRYVFLTLKWAIFHRFRGVLLWAVSEIPRILRFI